MLRYAILAAVFISLFFLFFGSNDDDKFDDPAQYEKLLREVEIMERSPCDTQLRFVKLFGTWHITCDGCPGIPASKVFPKIAIRVLDDYSVGNKMTLTEYLQLDGSCI